MTRHSTKNVILVNKLLPARNSDYSKKRSQETDHSFF